MAEGPAIGGVGGSCGVALLRLRLFGDGGVVVKIDWERVVRRWVVVISDDVVCGTVLLRLGLGLLAFSCFSVMCGLYSVLVVFMWRWDIVFREALGTSCAAVPLCRYCCSLPLKLVILLTGTSSTVSRGNSSSSTLGWISVDGGILFGISLIDWLVLRFHAAWGRP